MLRAMTSAAAATAIILAYRRWRQCKQSPCICEPIDIVFGYGSIINCSSRNCTKGGACCCRAAVLCTLKPSAGWERAWCFRASTGFTALGLRPGNPESGAVCGVAFPVGGSLAAFDKREAGYARREISREELACCLDTDRNFRCDCACAAAADVGRRTLERVSSLSRLLQPPPSGCHALTMRRFASWLDGDEAGAAGAAAGSSAAAAPFRVWAYVPLAQNLCLPSRAYPICESYLDVVLHGCLEWGGEPLALAFCETTAGWSECFLDDVVVSRRPWLHRPTSWAQIERVLRSRADITLVGHRSAPPTRPLHLTTRRPRPSPRACIGGALIAIPPRRVSARARTCHGRFSDVCICVCVCVWRVVLIVSSVRSEDAAAAAQGSFDALAELVHEQHLALHELRLHVGRLETRLEAVAGYSPSSHLIEAANGHEGGTALNVPNAPPPSVLATPAHAAKAGSGHEYNGVRRPPMWAPLTPIVVRNTLAASPGPNAQPYPLAEQPGASGPAASCIVADGHGAGCLTCESPRKRALREQSPSLALALARAEQRKTHGDVVVEMAPLSPLD